MNRSTSDIVVTCGLAAGAIFGLAGTVVPTPELRQLCWLVDGLGVVVATTLLALRYFRSGEDMVAAGFLVFAMGECLLIAGVAAGIMASIPTFAGGVGLWSAGLLMTSLPSVMPAWVRAVGTIGAVLFGAVAVMIVTGQPLTPIARPLPYFAYPFVVATFVGWILTTWRVTEPRTARQP